MSPRLMLCWLIVAGNCGCHSQAPPVFPAAVLTTLETAEEYELYSLDPIEPAEPPAEDSSERFHGWKVLGKVSIGEQQTRSRLNKALRSGARNDDQGVAACFWPRHGIRVTKDDIVTDYVICFQCARVLGYVKDQNIASFAIEKSPQPAFDAVLGDAGVALPKGN